MTQKTFSVNDFIAVYGATQLTGFVDGSFITISYDADAFNYVNGADGEVARVKTKKLMATITVRLLQTSLTNDALSAYFFADFEGNATQNFILKDLNGNTILESSECSIPKIPDAEYGTEPTNREWTIKAPKLIGLLGGNYR